MIANAAKWQGRVRYIHHAHPTGLADAFNRVAKLAASDFVVFLSADDLIDRDLLENLERGLLAFPEARFCYVANRYIDATGQPVSPQSPQGPSSPCLLAGQEYVRNYLMGCLANQHVHRCLGFAVERKLLEECPFRKEAGILADEDLFIRLAAKTKVVGIATPHASVRMHSGAISSRMESLNFRVAADYVSLIRFIETEPQHVAEQDRPVVYELLYRSLSLLLLEAILRGRRDLASQALRLMQESRLLIDDGTAGSLIKARGGILALIYARPRVTTIYRLLVGTAESARKLKRMVIRASAPHISPEKSV